jgi:hypothetical protein
MKNAPFVSLLLLIILNTVYSERISVGGNATFEIPINWAVRSFDSWDGYTAYLAETSRGTFVRFEARPAPNDIKVNYSNSNQLKQSLMNILLEDEARHLRLYTQNHDITKTKFINWEESSYSYGSFAEKNFIAVRSIFDNSISSFPIYDGYVPQIFNTRRDNIVCYDGEYIYVINSFYDPFDNSIPSDEINQIWEIKNSGLSSNIINPTDDDDNDGLPNYFEKIYTRTDINNNDTDQDGYSDYQEYSSKMDPKISHQWILDEISDLRVNSTMIEVSGNQATVQLQMEESSDLQTWEDTGTPATMTIPADTDTKFFRFKMTE